MGHVEALAKVASTVRRWVREMVIEAASLNKMWHGLLARDSTASL
jgi:hypothetical protein